ncbi:basic proline-rich protein-like [Sarcophilus harrisii]|uniref:basic proline-rich protein-like n=1 Tax=Sarcophilus harrisii TaxID=9305 RepID=UPI001301C330|nr:basic proline-rich protein-like [Sarcophilus harrisii]
MRPVPPSPVTGDTRPPHPLPTLAPRALPGPGLRPLSQKPSRVRGPSGAGRAPPPVPSPACEVPRLLRGRDTFVLSHTLAPAPSPHRATGPRPSQGAPAARTLPSSQSAGRPAQSSPSHRGRRASVWGFPLPPDEGTWLNTCTSTRGLCALPHCSPSGDTEPGMGEPRGRATRWREPAPDSRRAKVQQTPRSRPLGEAPPSTAGKTGESAANPGGDQRPPPGTPRGQNGSDSGSKQGERGRPGKRAEAGGRVGRAGTGALQGGPGARDYRAATPRPLHRPYGAASRNPHSKVPVAAPPAEAGSKCSSQGQAAPSSLASEPPVARSPHQAAPAPCPRMPFPANPVLASQCLTCPGDSCPLSGAPGPRAPHAFSPLAAPRRQKSSPRAPEKGRQGQKSQARGPQLAQFASDSLLAGSGQAGLWLVPLPSPGLTRPSPGTDPPRSGLDRAEPRAELGKACPCAPPPPSQIGSAWAEGEGPLLSQSSAQVIPGFCPFAPTQQHPEQMWLLAADSTQRSRRTRARGLVGAWSCARGASLPAGPEWARAAPHGPQRLFPGLLPSEAPREAQRPKGRQASRASPGEWEQQSPQCCCENEEGKPEPHQSRLEKGHGLLGSRNPSARTRRPGTSLRPLENGASCGQAVQRAGLWPRPGFLTGKARTVPPCPREDGEEHSLTEAPKRSKRKETDARAALGVAAQQPGRQEGHQRSAPREDGKEPGPQDKHLWEAQDPPADWPWLQRESHQNLGGETYFLGCPGGGGGYRASLQSAFKGQAGKQKRCKKGERAPLGPPALGTLCSRHFPGPRGPLRAFPAPSIRASLASQEASKEGSVAATGRFPRKKETQAAQNSSGLQEASLHKPLHQQTLPGAPGSRGTQRGPGGIWGRPSRSRAGKGPPAGPESPRPQRDAFRGLKTANRGPKGGP